MTEAYYQQHQLIFRVPERLTEIIKKVIDSKDDELDAIDEGDARKKNINNFTIVPDMNNINDNLFSLILDDITYPALLYNLPTIVETHKTFDKKNYTKTGEIGQVLHVFTSNKEREEFAKNKIKKTIHGEYAKSGLTLPTNDIVSRRFDKTNNITVLQQSAPSQILEVINDINAPWDAETNPQHEEKEARETIYEEVVDFEDWMISKDHPNGIVINLEGQNWASCPEFQILLDHPEILNLQQDIEYDKYIMLNESKSAIEAQSAHKDNIAGENAVTVDSNTIDFEQSGYNMDENDEDDNEGENDEDNDWMKEVKEDEDDNDWMKEVKEDEDDNNWMKEVDDE